MYNTKFFCKDCGKMLNVVAGTEIKDKPSRCPDCNSTNTGCYVYETYEHYQSGEMDLATILKEFEGKERKMYVPLKKNEGLPLLSQESDYEIMMHELCFWYIPTAERQNIYIDLMDLLSLQKAEGGFDFDSKLVELIRLPALELNTIALKIQLTGKADRLVLLGTALVLQILEQKFSYRKGEWGAMVQKTSEWFNQEIKAALPTINGVSLVDWASDFVKRKVV